MMMLILYRAMQISFFLSFRNAKLVNVFVCHSLWSKSSRSLGCSHRGQLQRQPSWKWWYRPGTVCFCLKAFRLLQNRNVPRLRYLSLPFSPPSFLPSPVSAVQIVSFANLKKQVCGWGVGAEEMNYQPKKLSPLIAHTRPPPCTLSSRYPPQLIWIN